VAKKLSRILPFIVAAIGIGLIVYPYISDWYYKGRTAEQVLSVDESTSSEDDSKLTEEMERAVEYNRKLAQNYNIVTDPFDPDAGSVPGEDYEDILNLNGDGVMATLYIPKISVAMPIYHTTSDDVLQKGVGHMPTTSLPVGGESTHAVLAGHNGLPSMKVFDDLTKLEVGDYFIIRVLGEDHAYRITSIETVLPDETSSCTIQEGKDLVTLVTCVPYGVNTHRLLVHAERCEVPQEWLDQGSDQVLASAAQSTRTPLIVFSLIGAGIAALFIVVYVHMKKKRERKAAAMVAGAPRHMASSPKKRRRSKNPRARPGSKG
jgi:sortase A